MTLDEELELYERAERVRVDLEAVFGKADAVRVERLPAEYDSWAAYDAARAAQAKAAKDAARKAAERAFWRNRH